jgi:drug/metabolite transporter (DMT)-like permease
MGTLAPVSIALSAVIFLGERPSFLVWVGIFLTVSGVAWVLWERMPQNKIVKNKSLGIKYSLISIICMTVGVIFAKVGVTSVSAIQATLIRLLWAVIGLTLWGCMNHQLKKWLVPLRNPRLLRSIFFVVFIVVFGGFWLSLVALKHIDASVASALNSTAPLFILPMAAIMLKEKVSIQAGLGAAIAVGGVVLLFMGG